MKFSKKMTERDRRIMMAVTSILVFAVMSLGVIHPIHVAVKSMEQQIENYEKQTVVMEEKTENLEKMRDSVQEKQERLNRLRSELLPMMPSQKLDQLLTEKALESGLVIMSLQISMPESAADIPAFGAEDGWDYDTEEQEGIYIAAAGLSVCGTMTALESFLDEISEGIRGVRVTALDWEPDTGMMDGEMMDHGMMDHGTMDHETMDVMRMELEIYMCR